MKPFHDPYKEAHFVHSTTLYTFILVAVIASIVVVAFSVLCSPIVCMHGVFNFLFFLFSFFPDKKFCPIYRTMLLKSSLRPMSRGLNLSRDRSVVEIFHLYKMNWQSRTRDGTWQLELLVTYQRYSFCRAIPGNILS